MLKIKEKKEKNWLIRSSDSSSYRVAVSEIAANLGINPIVAKLLYNRGYTNLASAKAFVYMESEMLLDPFKMKDIEKCTADLKVVMEIIPGMFMMFMFMIFS